MRLALLATLALLAALPAAAADRVALLIGNNNYAAAPLRNAVNDARDLAGALKELGFTVIVKENATRRDMIDAIREFGTALDGASTALFFYAGHAMQFKDRNYLVPIDAAMGSEEDVTFFSVEVGQIFDRMDRAKTRFNFLVLDACRDNPFASSFKVSSAGLAQMSSPSGTLIGYATAPGSVAADGYGRNGMYTHHILQNIRVPDLPVEIMFKRVREGVERETKRQQTPWDSSSLKGDFAFNPTSRSTGVASGGSSGPSADSQLQIEREFWISVRDSNRADDIQAYLDKYPSGNFAPLAKNRLEALLRPTRVASAPPEMRSGASANSQAAPSGSAPIEPAAASAPSASSASTAAPAKAAEKPVVIAAAPASTAPAARPSPSPAAVVAAPPTATAPVPAPAAAAPKQEEQPGKEIQPGVREFTFADGSVYRGAMRGSSLHGKGEYVSKAFQYQGEFKDNQKHGTGVYVWENGDRYQGEFADDRPSGKGKWTFASGDTYEGDVKAGVIVGRGTSTTKSGDSFDGSFVDGKPQGTGVYRFASGDRYEGEMSNGRMNGQGRYVAKDGYVIQGRFKDGQAQGPGTYTFANGDRYEGEIRGGALTGQGAYFYANGLKYEGDMANGLPNGKGVFWFNDGTRFEGQFEGLAKAKGEVVKADGSRVPAEMVGGNVRWLN
ncbi:hypothetical protein DSM104443_00441 [Usitatibacter rugosus]|uniref:Caspase family p20 domain-containing protein n=1 Tax=Usitatibacter rugosus TaxID=2732067 RepID=A0A6M4GUW8_9PROT|nr:caspase family protein [Usitatibacter rugosus]QJR09397.1 hypothetical protein DSM104443_00441 [Usitatibacter rugosus]